MVVHQLTVIPFPATFGDNNFGWFRACVSCDRWASIDCVRSRKWFWNTKNYSLDNFHREFKFLECVRHSLSNCSRQSRKTVASKSLRTTDNSFHSSHCRHVRAISSDRWMFFKILKISCSRNMLLEVGRTTKNTLKFWKECGMQFKEKPRF